MFRAYCMQENEELAEASIEEVFPFLRTKGHVVSLVGGGGKTTLMYQMAEYYSESGYHTLVTTTTHIFKPESGIFARTKTEIEGLWKQSKIAVIGEETLAGKLKQPKREKLCNAMKWADITFVEADGAKQMACKVPNDTEPVILPECDIVIGVIGLEVIGKPLSEACFRMEEAMRLLKVSPNHILTEENVVEILTSVSGTKKGVGEREYYIVLNKCDSVVEREYGEKILKLLYQKEERHAIMTCLKNV